jgi:hypothetical protein
MAYRGAVPRRNRVYLSLRAELVDEASELAMEAGDVLADLVHGAIITATKAAEAGHHDLLPKAPPPQPRRRRGEGVALTSFRYTASASEEERCDRSLAAAGSSLTVIAEATLRAYIDARGSRLDTPMPGEPWLVRVAVGAA